MYIPLITPAFGWLIGFIYKIFGQNYMLALIIFAILVKLILFPFGIKQQKNSVKQASLRPMEAAIRKKYAGRNDKATQQKCQQEIMELYQQNNYNPASGCLPLLLQMPILFGLYSVIINPLKYVSGLGADIAKVLCEILGIQTNYDIHAIRAITNMGDAVKPAFLDKLGLALGESGNAAEIFNTVSELPAKHFSVFGIDLTVTPNLTSWYVLIPILTFVFAFFGTKLTRKFTYQPQQTADANASMAMMDWMMPLLSVWISLSVPSAIAIYWMLQNVLSVAQQYILAKMYPIPEVTEAEMREAELQLKGKSAAKKEKNDKLPEPDMDSPIYEDIPDFEYEGSDPALRVANRSLGLTKKFKKQLKANGKAPKAKRKI